MKRLKAFVNAKGPLFEHLL